MVDDYRVADSYGYVNDETSTYGKEGLKGIGWLPLLLIPIFAFLGWVANDAIKRDSATQVATNGTQFGVGGAPFIPCVSPSPEATEDTDMESPVDPTPSIGD